MTLVWSHVFACIYWSQNEYFSHLFNTNLIGDLYGWVRSSLSSRFRGKSSLASHFQNQHIPHIFTFLTFQKSSLFILTKVDTNDIYRIASETIKQWTFHFPNSSFLTACFSHLGSNPRSLVIWSSILGFLKSSIFCFLNPREEETILKSSFSSFFKGSLVTSYSHLKLWFAIATCNFKWLKILKFIYTI